MCVCIYISYKQRETNFQSARFKLLLAGMLIRLFYLFFFLYILFVFIFFVTIAFCHSSACKHAQTYIHIHT